VLTSTSDCERSSRSTHKSEASTGHKQKPGLVLVLVFMWTQPYRSLVAYWLGWSTDHWINFWLGWVIIKWLLPKWPTVCKQVNHLGI